MGSNPTPGMGPCGLAPPAVGWDTAGRQRSLAGVILHGPVSPYIAGLTRDSDRLLAEMRDHADEEKIPVVEPPTGRMLEVLARVSGARRAVEVGTAIGVSTLHLARAGAHVTSFEIDDLRHAAAVSYLRRAGFEDRVDLRLQDADAGLATLTAPFDLAFVDGPKQGYRDHIDAAVELLRPGGVLVVDNVLMSGTVATGVPSGPWRSEQIDAMRVLNERLVTDARLLTAITPVGDGLAVAARL